MHPLTDTTSRAIGFASNAGARNMVGLIIYRKKKERSNDTFISQTLLADKIIKNK